jgi:hypothetical protein
MASLHGLGSVPLWVMLVLVVLLSVGIPSLLVNVVRRVWPYPSLKENNELVGFTYAVFGLIYGVLMAFAIILSWERYAETEHLVTKEVTVLSELWRDAQAFEAGAQGGIERDLMAYAESVALDEWPAMASSGEGHERTARIYEDLWRRSYALAAKTDLQSAFLGEYVARLNELSGARRLRILHSRAHMPGVLWLVLVVGAVPTVLYPLFFANKHAWVHVAITSFVTLIVLLNLVVLVSLQHPFTGDVRIGPGEFTELAVQLRGRQDRESGIQSSE